jgi:inorganic pyrophosphatase
VERLRHYFLTYKQAPDAMRKACEITHVYGAEEAKEVIRRSNLDYLDRYDKQGDPLDETPPLEAEVEGE